MELFKQHAGNVNVVVASRYNETEVYTVTQTIDKPVGIQRVSFREENIQMTLFG